MVSSILNLNTGASALAIQADVSSVPEITRLFEESIAHFGHLDIVCSNSGMESFDKTLDITEERFDLVMGLNFRAQFFVAQHAYRYLREGGRVVLMSSIAAGLIGVGDHALYSASKSAVNGVTKSFAKDFGQRGITVNAIAPGGVKSDMFTQVAWRYIPGELALFLFSLRWLVLLGCWCFAWSPLFEGGVITEVVDWCFVSSLPTVVVFAALDPCPY